MLDEVVVEIGLGIEHQALLMQLELMQKEHQHDRDEQRDERRVERDAETLRDAGDIAFDRFVGLCESIADAAHRADEPDRRDGPRDVADHGELGLESIRFRVANSMRRR